MQFSENWLRSLSNPSMSTEALSHLLTMCGLEVEEVSPYVPSFSSVVVAQVLSVERHPNADRLNVCQVDVGQGKTLNIVCGASNVRAGLKVACALAGAVLPPNENGVVLEIKVGELRGVESQGMLCSARELGLLSELNGLLELPLDAPVGQDFRTYYDLNDQIFTVKLTPNRADCLSLVGVAREVFALTGAVLKLPSFNPVGEVTQEVLPVKILAPDLCGRFVGRVIRGVNARAQTPLWMKQRLEKSGLRSISALVDISNYVMLEYGRPTHIFDLHKITGGLSVRWAREGESLLLLNGSTVALDPLVGVVADDNGVLALAGIMGGEESAVTLETTDIYLEAAFWLPEAIAGRARRYNFSSDASHRFERGVDYASIVEHVERITALIIDICTTPDMRVGKIDDQTVNVPSRLPVRVRSARVKRVIGITISDEQITDIFTRLQFVFTQTVGDFGTEWTVIPPSYRFDIAIEEDLIEEIVRVYGFENVPALPPVAKNVMLLAPEDQRSLFAIRHQLVDLDYQEVVNFSFVDESWEADFAGNRSPIKLKNPIASQMSVMRSSLIGSLVANLQYNVNRKASRVRIFEIGAVYFRDDNINDGAITVAHYAQPKRVAALAYGSAEGEQWGQPNKNVDYFDMKADLEALLSPRVVRFRKAVHPALHPGRSAEIVWQERVVGYLGELHPSWQQKYALPFAPLVFEIDAEMLQNCSIPQFVEIVKFPEVTRDLALVVKTGVSAQEIVDIFDALRAQGKEGEIVQGIHLFDEYRGAGLENDEKSLAFRFILQDTHATLQDERVDRIMSSFVAAVNQYCGARLRA
jgi:phenylalanyl-tRNA synthetase beta chain